MRRSHCLRQLLERSFWRTLPAKSSGRPAARLRARRRPRVPSCTRPSGWPRSRLVRSPWSPIGGTSACWLATRRGRGLLEDRDGDLWRRRSAAYPPRVRWGPAHTRALGAGVAEANWPRNGLPDMATTAAAAAQVRVPAALRPDVFVGVEVAALAEANDCPAPAAWRRRRCLRIGQYIRLGAGPRLAPWGEHTHPAARDLRPHAGPWAEAAREKWSFECGRCGVSVGGRGLLGRLLAQGAAPGPHEPARIPAGSRCGCRLATGRPGRQRGAPCLRRPALPPG